MLEWRVTAAKRTGKVHELKGEPCADSFVVRQGKSVLVLVVADGAGSARFGAAGASIASRRAAENALALADKTIPGSAKRQRALLRKILQRTLADLLSAIDSQRCRPREAETEGSKDDWRGVGVEWELDQSITPSDFHTTLLIAILSKQLLLVGNVGDGWLVARSLDGRLRTVAPPIKGEYCNETFFLTSDGAFNDAVLEVIPNEGLDGIALMTDGSAWFAIDLASGEPGEAVMNKLFAFAERSSLTSAERDRQLEAFLASEAVVRRSDDDKTLIFAIRTPRSLSDHDPPT